MTDVAQALRERAAAVQQRDGHARCREVTEQIEQRLKTADAGADGAVTYTYDPGTGPGAHWMTQSAPGLHRIEWTATFPPRSLLVKIDEPGCTVQWAWSRDHAPIGEWQAVDAFAFTLDFLDRLVLGLAEQEIWASGDTPTVY